MHQLFVLNNIPSRMHGRRNAAFKLGDSVPHTRFAHPAATSRTTRRVNNNLNVCLRLDLLSGEVFRELVDLRCGAGKEGALLMNAHGYHLQHALVRQWTPMRQPPRLYPPTSHRPVSSSLTRAEASFWNVSVMYAGRQKRGGRENLLRDIRHGRHLIQQTRLALWRQRVGRVEPDPSVQQRAMEVTHQRACVAAVRRTAPSLIVVLFRRLVTSPAQSRAD